MHLIERYIITEVARPLVVVLAALVAIFASYTVGRYLNDAASGAMGMLTALHVTGYRVLIALDVLAPVAFYLSVVLGIGRLHHDQEMNAFSAAGVSPMRILASVALLAFPVAVAVALLSVYVRPWAYASAYALEAQAKTDLDLSHLQAGRFNINPDNDRMILPEQIDTAGNRLDNVLIYTRSDHRTHLTIAQTAHLADPDPAHPVLELQNGVSYSLEKRGPADRSLEFGDLTLILDPITVTADYKRKAASTAQLAQSQALPERAELQWRLSRGPTTLLLALLAVPLSRTPPRRGRFANMLPVTGVFVAVYYAGGVTKNLIESGQLPLMPGMWWIPLLMMVALVVLLRHRGGH